MITFDILTLATDATLAAEAAKDAERDMLKLTGETPAGEAGASGEDSGEDVTAPSTAPATVSATPDGASGEDAKAIADAKKRAYGARKRSALALNLAPDASGAPSTAIGVAFTQFARGEAIVMPHQVGEYPEGTLVQHAERYGAVGTVNPDAKLIGKAIETGDAPSSPRATASRAPGAVTTVKGATATRDDLDRVRDGIRAVLTDGITSESGAVNVPSLAAVILAAREVLSDSKATPATVRDALTVVCNRVDGASHLLSASADRLNVLANPERANLADRKVAFIAALRARSAADNAYAEAIALDDSKAISAADDAVLVARQAFSEAERLYNLARA